MMAPELQVAALLTGFAVNVAVLMAPLLKMHSRLDLIEYRIKRLEALLDKDFKDT